MPDRSPMPILYTQAGCGESAKVRAWLTDHGIPVTERDASADSEAAMALAATGTFATPLLVVDERKVLGFRPEALAAALRPFARTTVHKDGGRRPTMSTTRAAASMLRLTEAGGPLDFGPDRARLFVRVARTLGQGQPIESAQFEQIVAQLAVSPEEGQRFLNEWTERDANGAIVGMGLTLNETPHQISINGSRLWAWCAEDTLFYPIVLEQAATVASASPLSGELTRVRVSPTQVEEVNPAEAVVSLPVVDPEEADLSSVNAIWETFCHHSFFFPSRSEGEQWASGRDDIEFVSVEEGFAIARQLTARMLSDAL